MTQVTIAPSAIRDALAEVGVQQGDTVLVHSDAIIAAQLPPLPVSERLDLIIDALETSVGPDGTVVMPAFSYSFTKGEIFDLMRTPSDVGMLTERFRQAPSVCRSADPIFSIAAKGPQGEVLGSAPIRECFGPDSTFSILHRLNSYIICLGCPLTSGGTFVHYVEKTHGVTYRYDKVFAGTIVWPGGKSTHEQVVYHVRNLERRSGADLRRLQSRLEACGHLKKTTVGRIRVLGVRTSAFYETASQMLDEDPVSLIEEGALPQESGKVL
jgi:aminoglycoside 3-N-acetyltransferase